MIKPTLWLKLWKWVLGQHFWTSLLSKIYIHLCLNWSRQTGSSLSWDLDRPLHLDRAPTCVRIFSNVSTNMDDHMSKILGMFLFKTILIIFLLKKKSYSMSNHYYFGCLNQTFFFYIWDKRCDILIFFLKTLLLWSMSNEKSYKNKYGFVRGLFKIKFKFNSIYVNITWWFNT